MNQALRFFLRDFASLNNEKWGDLLLHWKFERLQKGKHFIRSGAPCNRIAFLEEGVMRTSAPAAKGSEFTCSFIIKNTFITDVDAYLKRGPATSNYIAVSDCSLWVLSYEAEQVMIRQVPEWLTMRERIIVYMMNYFLEIHAMQVHLDAKARYEHFTRKFPDVLKVASLGHIASFLGITQPSLSRIRKEV